MKDVVVGAVGGFFALIVNKSVLEPIATQIGRRTLNRYISPACALVDQAMLRIGVTCNPEGVVRSFLELEPEEFTPDQVQLIVDEVFRVYDVRKIMRSER